MLLEMNNLHLSHQSVLKICFFIEGGFDCDLMMLCCVGPTSNELLRENSGGSVCGKSQASEGRSGLI